jgi:DNA-directed RNA polymerase subunit RPC12/RpoP
MPRIVAVTCPKCKRTSLRTITNQNENFIRCRPCGHTFMVLGWKVLGGR